MGRAGWGTHHGAPLRQGIWEVPEGFQSMDDWVCPLERAPWRVSSEGELTPIREIMKDVVEDVRC